MPKNNHTQTYKYSVAGMHCASCEMLIEEKLRKEPNIISVNTSKKDSVVTLTTENKKPSLNQINSLFSKEGYSFTTFKNSPSQDDTNYSNSPIIYLFSALLIIIFLLLNRTGLLSLSSVSSASSMPAFFIFGLLAGLSTCAALVGGMILSLSKIWGGSLRPHFLFYIGRVLSYIIFGALLGLIGSTFKISPIFTSFFTILISLFMIALALQMYGVKAFQKLNLTLPKSLTQPFLNNQDSKNQYFPFILGASTFFLPCGFTITVQALAITSGDPILSAFMLFSFVLGTLVSLIIISLVSNKFQTNPKSSQMFYKIAAILVFFFALFNINSQFNALGIKSFNDLFIGKASAQISDQNTQTDNNLAPIINGKQVIKMSATSYSYEPNYFKVKAGVPVRWEITDKGVSGCTNTVISKGLFEGEIEIEKDKTVAKEFTPKTPGKYKFSCWMGMVTGIIEVVSDTSSIPSNNNQVFESGSRGGCGGCSSGTCKFTQ